MKAFKELKDTVLAGAVVLAILYVLVSVGGYFASQTNPLPGCQCVNSAEAK